MKIYVWCKIGILKLLIYKAVTELNEDTQDQICDLLENHQYIDKLKIKIFEFYLIKLLGSMEEK